MDRLEDGGWMVVGSGGVIAGNFQPFFSSFNLFPVITCTFT